MQQPNGAACRTMRCFRCLLFYVPIKSVSKSDQSCSLCISIFFDDSLVKPLGVALTKNVVFLHEARIGPLGEGTAIKKQEV